MKAPVALLLAVVIALAGAALYAVVQFKLGLVGGLIAYPLGWGVGKLISVGFAGANGRPAGPVGGVMAAIIAMGGMVMSKFFVIWLAQASGVVIDDFAAAVSNEFDALDILWFGIAAWPAWDTGSGRAR